MASKRTFIMASAIVVAMVGVAVGKQTVSSQNDEIVLGMSTALTGPAAKLGLNMQAGVSVAFAEVNAVGGVNGMELKLIALDDGYEPSRTAPNMHTLIEEDEVLAIIGNVGTPTAIASIPIANANGTLLFGAYTGAGALRKSPPDRFVINYRASYAQETAAMVDGLIKHAGLHVNEIAFFTQRDAYGDAGFIGGITALKGYGLDDDNEIAHGRYERNTTAVENGLADIIMAKTPVKAVVMVGSYAPCAVFIKLAKEYGFQPIFLNVSFVGSTPLANELGSDGNGVIITQVVPHFESDLDIAQEYRASLSQYDAQAEPNFGSFEGYIVARILIQAMSQSIEPLTQSSIVDAIEAMGTFEIGLGQELTLSKEMHQASSFVWPTVIQDNKIVAFSWDQLDNIQSGAALSEVGSD